MATVLAYIDAGSGSFIFQAVVGSAMAAALGAKVLWRRVSGLFRRDQPPTDNPLNNPLERP
jgi:hypothetical protein